MTLAVHLLAWRRRRGLTLAQAGVEFGVTTTTVRNWELGRCPQPLQLMRLADHFGWTPEEARAMAGPDRVRTPRTSGGAASSPLAQARLAAGLTMTQVAMKVGVVPATVSRWENGIRHPSKTFITRLAAALALSERDVLTCCSGGPPSRDAGVILAGLRALRVEREVTQRAFAAALGISTGTAHKWENGSVRVPRPRLADVADVLSTSVADLLQRAADQPRRPARTPHPLAQLRRRAGMSQREAAHLLDLSVGTMVRLEGAQRQLRVDTARRMAVAYRCPLVQVLRAGGLQVPELLPPTAWSADRLPEVLAALRWSTGLSAAELGRRLLTSGRRVRAWELNRTVPPPEVLRRFELHLHLPPGQLVALQSAAS